MNKQAIETELTNILKSLHESLLESNRKAHQQNLRSVLLTHEHRRFFSRKKADEIHACDVNFDIRLTQMLLSWGMYDCSMFMDKIDKSLMTEILKTRLEPYDYNAMNIESCKSFDKVKYNIVIPVKKQWDSDDRKMHTRTIALYLNNILKDREDWGVCFVVQEPDSEITNDLKNMIKAVSWKNVNIFTIVSDAAFMKKSACYNYVCKEVECEWQVNHDVDLLFSDLFISEIEKFCSSGGGDFYQPYYGGSVTQLNQEETHHLLESACYDNLICDLNKYVIENKPKATEFAPGGSVVVRQSLMKKVGGYDPQIIDGYGPEDSMFWLKLEIFTGRPDYTDIKLAHLGYGCYCENNDCQIFHFQHAPGHMDIENSLLPLTYYLFWRYATPVAKLNFLERLDGVL